MLAILESPSLFWVALLLPVLWTIYGAIWRLYWSPLAGFPGPKSVALTLWVEFYYDVIKNGMFMWEVEKMHAKYGPIVRVSPYELHCNDPDFFDTIYASLPAQRDKCPKFARSPDCNNATGFTVQHAHHRLRRNALAPFFSHRNTVILEDRIKSCVDRLCLNLQHHHVTQRPFNLTVQSLAATMDIFTSYSFGESLGMLADEAKALKWRDTIVHIMKALPIVRSFPFMARLVPVLPASVARVAMPDISVLMEWKQHIGNQVADVLAYKGPYAQSTRESKTKTILEELRDTSKLPPEEKTLQRLSEEGSILLIAGSETPAKVNAILWYHLLANPDKLARLRAELATIYPDPAAPLPSITTLKTLPYLESCVLEALRLQSGVSGRSPRLAPTPLQYKQYTIPAWTPLSSISVFQHYNETIFPEPKAFVPERWLTQGPDGASETIRADLKKDLVAFGHGARSCLGQSLAYAELYLLTVALATRVDLQLYETGIEDVEIQRDWTIPQPRMGSQGVRVMVKGVRY
ncbi:cytochrome P450 [Aspergillus steynii IBT 23096]|uniref:Cytochrome P450 n=1 Tax=Aspergillus steynii IBT 23096 TaxID=1392250 RepID=A0A2I2G072_9EURO|nr:cytochrome P450 [Aspergillus steynii IBT 23096]PLB46285.1 cytochrome P450 [Aspergillus steynii IBT 23096]